MITNRGGWKEDLRRRQDHHGPDPRHPARSDAGHARVLGHGVMTQAGAVRRQIALTGQFATVDDDLTRTPRLPGPSTSRPPMIFQGMTVGTIGDPGLSPDPAPSLPWEPLRPLAVTGPEHRGPCEPGQRPSSYGRSRFISAFM
jgi:hypothetical protein